MSNKPRIKLPSSAKKGDVIEIKTLLSHPMETGLRKDKKTGQPIPRKIINKFECKLNGQTVFSADINPSVSANPYFAFFTRAEKSGTMEFVWHEDGGNVISATEELKVT